ncbi:MAG: hypothetical protein R3B92_01045 [Patescibacteria group bacterium]
MSTRHLTFIILINFALAFIQTSFLYALSPAVYIPNLVLAFGYAFLVDKKLELGAGSLFIGGIFVDLFGLGIIGLTPLIFLTFFMIIRFLDAYAFKSWATYILGLILTHLGYFLLLTFSFNYFSFNLLIGTSNTLILCLSFVYINQQYGFFTQHKGFNS